MRDQIHLSRAFTNKKELPICIWYKYDVSNRNRRVQRPEDDANGYVVELGFRVQLKNHLCQRK